MKILLESLRASQVVHAVKPPARHCRVATISPMV
jgi:hypothetical protein